MNLLQFPGGQNLRFALGILCALAGLVGSTFAAPAPKPFAIPAGEASETLRQFSTQSGEQIVYVLEQVRGVRTKAVSGDFAPLTALERMLEGTTLQATRDPDTGALAVGRRNPPSGANPPGGVGALTGRVQNRMTGLYLNNARLTIEGTPYEAFTNDAGEYHFDELPAGPVRLKAFYTGMQPQTVPLIVPAGGTITQDFSLSGAFALAAAKEGEEVVLEAFVVASAKESSASEIAINEQRFSANIKSVVSTTAFGDIGQDNIGEFLKFMPGVEAVYGDMNISNVALRGMPSTLTPVSMDGASIVSTSTLSTDRNTSFAAISLNSVSRIEVSKVPLPDSRADSVGGSVNLVSRTAFEHSKPELRYKLFVQMNSRDPNLKKTPGGQTGGDGSEYKWFPNFELNYVNPITKTFGIAINASRNDKWVLSRRITKSHNITNALGTVAATNATSPYLSGFTLMNYPSFETRNASSFRFDWKFAPRDVLSFNATYNRYFSNFEQHNWVFNTGNLNAPLADGTRNAATGMYSPTYTQGRVNAGSVSQQLVTRYGIQPNVGASIGYRHTGADWDWDAIVSGNKSKVAYRNTSYGQFDQTRANISNVTVRYDDIGTYGPQRITVARTADVIDQADLSNYVLAPAANQTRDASASARNVNFNLKRKVSWARVFGSFKSGFAFRSDERHRKMGQYSPNYIGPNNVNTIGALPGGTLQDPTFSYYDFARGFKAPQWISARRVNTLFNEHPEYWNYPVANANADYQAMVGADEYLKESITAGYLMGDFAFFRNRVRLATGVRYERTLDEGSGLLTDNSRQYVKDDHGKIVDGNPNQAGVQPIALTTDPLEISKLTRISLGNHVKRAYGGYYPSASSTINATENLLVRLGYAKTLGRPNYGNILPTLSVSQVTNPADNATGSGLGTIQAKNPNLKPWQSHGYDISLEYYTRKGGVLSVGVFRKDITNFFTNTQSIATAEFLEANNLSQDYLGYLVNYPGNTNDQVRQTGLEIAANQRLARWLSVFSNFSWNRNQGPREGDFRGYVPRRANAGVSFNFSRVTLNLNYYYTPRIYTATNSLAPDGRTYTEERSRVDVSMDYRLTRRFSAFFWARNILNQRDRVLTYGTGTPDYARLNVESDYGVIFQVGVKGSF